MIQKKKSVSFINVVDDLINLGRNQGVLHRYTEDETYNGRTIRLGGKDLINFGSCSYLGLDVDQRIKDAAKDAIDRYGVQFATSRTYLSTTLYTEWESLMRQVFGAPVIMTTSTSLGHHAVLPVVVEEGDAIILDQQVHASIQDAAGKMVSKGVSVQLVRHNNMEELEAKIVELMHNHDRIWYMIDGIYSMYGDFPHLSTLEGFLNKYKQFHLYVDDAHGMSIAGKHGRGMVLSQMELHKKMILATSLCKAFAAGGGAFVFPDEQLCRKVMNTGGPLIFSGPHQIPVIGAGIASAKIHLSDEIYERQVELRKKLRYCHMLLVQNNLPVVSNPNAPITFIGCGLTRVGINLVARIINEGMYVNLSMFPAVPEVCTGLRFTITLHHTMNDIERLVEKLAYHFPKALAEEGRTTKDVHRAFRKVAHFKDDAEILSTKEIKSDKGYSIQHEHTIRNIPKELWNELIGRKGANDWDEMLFFEETFSGNILQEHNWNFHYYIVRDKARIPVLATFFTAVLAKDDMFSPAEVSKQLEEKRINNPYYLSSTMFMMGCMLSMGEHIYIDRSRADWKNILMFLLDNVWEEPEQQKAAMLTLRDFDGNDFELRDFFLEQGLLKVDLPDGHLIDELSWNSKEEFLNALTVKKRHFVKKTAVNHESKFEIRVVKNATEAEIDHYYQLYKNVSEKNFEINVFNYDRNFFECASKHPKWELLELKLKPEYDTREERKAVSIALSYNNGVNYTFLMVGMDYTYLKEYNVYAQTLWQTIVRANQLKLKTINLGLTASPNKRRFGPKVTSTTAYIQIKDHFTTAAIGLMANNKTAAVKQVLQKAQQ